MGEGVRAGYGRHHGQTDRFGKTFHAPVLSGHIAPVIQDAGHAAVPVAVEIAHAAQDVVGGVERHELAAGDQKDRVGVLPADRNGKAAAYHVAENVVKHVVVFVLYLVALQKLERGDDAAPRTAHAGPGSPGLYAADAPVSLTQYRIDDGGLLGHVLQIVQHGGKSASVHQQPCGVVLGVTADLQHPLASLGQRGRQVGADGGLADAAFSVKRQLPLAPAHDVYRLLSGSI